MILVKFINYYKPQFQFNEIYGFDENKANWLINNKYAIAINNAKESLNELEIETNTLVDEKKPVKSKRNSNK